MTFDLDRVKDSTTPMSLYRMTNRNNSPVSNTIKINQEQIQTTVSTEIFYWQKTWVVGASFTMSVGLPKYSSSGEIHIGVKRTKTVGSYSETNNTVVHKWSFETPITVPPYSELEFNMIVQQGQISVPFTATMRKGNDVWEEMGSYEGVDFFGMDVTIDVSDLFFSLTKNGTFRVL